MCVLVVRPCPTLCNPMDYILPGFSVLGIFQARILEWLLFPSPGDLSNPEIAPMSCISRQVLNHLNHQENPKSMHRIIPDQPSTLLHLLHALGISFLNKFSQWESERGKEESSGYAYSLSSSHSPASSSIKTCSCWRRPFSSPVSWCH